MSRFSLKAVALVAALGWTSTLAPSTIEAAPARRNAQKGTPTPKARPTPTSKKAAPKASSKATARGSARPLPTPPAKPDRALFQLAEKAEKALRGSSKLRAKRTEWEKVAAAYRTVVDRYPRSPYCDDALQGAGDLQRVMHRSGESGLSGQLHDHPSEQAAALLLRGAVDHACEFVVQAILLEVRAGGRSAGVGWRYAAHSCINRACCKRRVDAGAACKHMAVRAKHVGRAFPHAIAFEQCSHFSKNGGVIDDHCGS